MHYKNCRYSQYKPEDKKRSVKKISAIPIIAVVLVLAFLAFMMKNLTTQMALSDASDAVSSIVNKVVRDEISSGNYSLDYFVTLDKADDGTVNAIESNMAHINTLSANILRQIIESTDSGEIEVKVPLGNLFGIKLLSGYGHEVTMYITMLTSSRVDFKNDIYSSGINQTKYQLMLDVYVDIDVLLPWGSSSSTVLTEVLVADTVIVGQVPETYLELEN